MTKKRKIFLGLILIGIAAITLPAITYSFVNKTTFYSDSYIRSKYLELTNINKKLETNNTDLKNRIKQLQDQNKNTNLNIKENKDKINLLETERSKKNNAKQEFIDLYSSLKSKNSKTHAEIIVIQNGLKTLDKKTENLKNVSKADLQTIQKEFEDLKQKTLAFIVKNNNLINDSFHVIQKYHGQKLIDDKLFKNVLENYAQYIIISKEYEKNIKNIEITPEKISELNLLITKFYNSLLESIVLIDTYNSEFLKGIFVFDKKTKDEIKGLESKNNLDASSILIKENEINVLKKEIDQNIKKIEHFNQIEVQNKKLSEENVNYSKKISELNSIYSSIITSSIDNFKNVYKLFTSLDEKNQLLLNKFNLLIETTEKNLNKYEKTISDSKEENKKFYDDINKVFELHSNFIIESNKLTSEYFLKILEDGKDAATKIAQVNLEKEELGREISLLETKLIAKETVLEKTKNLVEISEKKNQTLDSIFEVVKKMGYVFEIDAVGDNKIETFIQKLKVSNDKLSADYEELKIKIKELKDSELSKDKLILELQSKISTQNNVVGSLNQTISLLRTEIKYLNSFKGPNGELVNYADYKDLSNKFNSLQNQNNNSNNIIEKLKKEDEKNKNTIAKMIEDQNELLKKLNTITTENNRLEYELSKYEKKINSLIIEKAALENLYKKVNQKITKINVNLDEITKIITQINEANEKVSKLSEEDTSIGSTIKNGVLSALPLPFISFSVVKFEYFSFKKAIREHSELLREKLKTVLKFLEETKKIE